MAPSRRHLDSLVAVDAVPLGLPPFLRVLRKSVLVVFVVAVRVAGAGARAVHLDERLQVHAPPPTAAVAVTEVGHCSAAVGAVELGGSGQGSLCLCGHLCCFVVCSCL